MKNETSQDDAQVTVGRAWRLEWRALRLCWRLRPAWFVATVGDALMKAALPYATIWFSARLIDELAGARDPARLRMWVLLILAVGAALGLAAAVFARWRDAEDEAMELVARQQVTADKLSTVDFPILDDQRTSDVVAHILQSDRMAGKGLRNVTLTFGRALPGIFQITGGAALSVGLFTSPVPGTPDAGWLVALNHPMAGAALFALLIADVALSSLCYAKSSMVWFRFDDMGRFGNRVFRSFGLLFRDRRRALDLRMYRQYERVALPFWKTNNTFGVHAKSYRMITRVMGPLAALSAGVSALPVGVIYAFVCLKAWGGAFGVGAVTQYVGAITTMFAGVHTVLNQAGEIRANGPFLQRLFAFLDTPNTMYQGTLTTEKRSDREYDVEFRDVSFRYPGAPEGVWALRHANVKFRVGSRLAVVGENGSGKTTFIKLLCRLYDPTEGQILLNGIDVRKYRYDEYMRIFAVVFQDFRLLALPLGQNVAGSASYDPALAARCLRDADFGERFASLPHGLDTFLYRELDPDGVEISGGEAQKIAIARALYRDAPFIVLDEPTAALDPVAEAEIYERFDRIALDRTAVYISHRLSSCRFCDEVAVFDHGRIVQTGTHDQLVADRSGKYYELWHAQAQYYA
ncbi:ABC transporter ATP-binding protein [Bifidobacterium avesanii]|uniref:ATP-binding cassette domain-containing protein n=1 Tax=Bifidobacterium avesanii TaxID=1798157 RepID=A0A7K3TJC4_9BIFI|nr:ABC transporter ATP-binding protein [Bifidobacterium avesanii]NEG78710.1 ATP-binding cassette domain-containing protein [Bifidobacterium avesanii]